MISSLTFSGFLALLTASLPVAKDHGAHFPSASSSLSGTSLSAFSDGDAGEIQSNRRIEDGTFLKPPGTQCEAAGTGRENADLALEPRDFLNVISEEANPTSSRKFDASKLIFSKKIPKRVVA